MRIKINPHKRIGKVLFLVEGDVDEVIIIKHIFMSLFGYSIVSYDKRNSTVQELVLEGDPYSKVFIVPMKYSAISKILDCDEYMDNVYQTLKAYGLEKDESRKYLLFDRDRLSNRYSVIRNLFSVFKDPLDNDTNIGGLLLLSYPCIQSLLCECNLDLPSFCASKEVKKHLLEKGYEISDITFQKLMDGVNQMLMTIYSIVGCSFDKNAINNIESINIKVLDEEQDKYCRDNVFYTLSMMMVSLLDLGIIEIKESD